MRITFLIFTLYNVGKLTCKFINKYMYKKQELHTKVYYKINKIRTVASMVIICKVHNKVHKTLTNKVTLLSNHNNLAIMQSCNMSY